MEILAGARTPEQAHRFRRMVAALDLLPLAGMADFEDAATISRTCRRAGVTPRSQIDCLIAAVAIRTGTPVLHEDRDYAALAGVVPLPLVNLTS